ERVRRDAAPLAFQIQARREQRHLGGGGQGIGSALQSSFAGLHGIGRVAGQRRGLALADEVAVAESEEERPPVAERQLDELAGHHGQSAAARMALWRSVRRAVWPRSGFKARPVVLFTRASRRTASGSVTREKSTTGRPEIARTTGTRYAAP